MHDLFVYVCVCYCINITTFIQWAPSHVIHHTSYIIHHTPYIMHHTSYTIHHTSYIQIYTKHFNRPIDPWTEVIVTVGASSALFTICISLLNPGDEVVVFEPAFDIYLGQVDMVGAILRPVTLRVKHTSDNTAVWGFDEKELEKAFNSKTRILILNTVCCK